MNFQKFGGSSFQKLSPEAKSFYYSALENSSLETVDYYSMLDLGEVTNSWDLNTHILLFCIFSSLNGGSTCLRLTPEDFLRKIQFLEKEFNESKLKKIIEEIISGLEGDIFSSLVTKNPDEFFPIFHFQGKYHNFLYFQKFFKYEKRLKSALQNLMDETLPSTRGNLSEVLEDVLVLSPLCQRETQNPLLINNEQLTGLGISLIQNFSIISGGPGTGKTFIVLNLLRCLLRMGIPSERIFLTAPTGLAAQRISESINKGLDLIPNLSEMDQQLNNIKALTIHRLLKYSRWNNQFSYNQNNPLPLDVLIVDEVSMVNMILMTQLVEAIPHGARVVFLGDKDQLPSVEAGTVLAELIPPVPKTLVNKKTKDILHSLFKINIDETSEDGPLVNRIVVLKESFRSQKIILEAAQKINQGDLNFANEFWDNPTYELEGGRIPKGNKLHEESGIKLIKFEEFDLNHWNTHLDLWAESLYLSKTSDGQSSYKDLVKNPLDLSPASNSKGLLDLIFKVIDDARILTVLRAGIFGAEGINKRLEKVLAPILDSTAQGKWFAGKIVMMTKNDYERSLFNGEVGVVLYNKKGSYEVVFRKSEGYESFPLDIPPAIESSFATTVHKSQGAEFAKIFLILPPDPNHRLLSREILYTGLTRSKNFAIIYSSKNALRNAIQNKIERISGLEIWE